MVSVTQQIKFGTRSTPIAKDISDGGLTSATKGNWHMLEAQGYRHWTFTLYGTATGTFSVDIEGTDDTGNILVYPGGAMRAGAEGHADSASIVPKKLIIGITQLEFPQEYDRQVRAVRMNITAWSSVAGSLQCWASVVP